MSVEAITWALSQAIRPSSAKFVLVAMANCANPDRVCWPSIQYLSEATCQDRKTVIENIKRLKEDGFITDTGERRGQTAQVAVFQLTEGSQNRNSSESGTVPKTEAKSTVFPPKESRKRLERVPKTGHGTVRTVKEPSRKKKESPPDVHGDELVSDGLQPETAIELLAHRRRIGFPLTSRAWNDLKREASKAGWALEAAVDKTLAKGWRSFEAKYVQNERAPGEPDWVREKRERMQKLAGPAAAKPKHTAEIIDVTSIRLG